MLHTGSVLNASGCDVRLVDYLDRDPPDLDSGTPRPPDRPNGTGQYLSAPAQKPGVFQHIPRNFRRFGLPRSLAEQRLSHWKDEGWVPDVVLLTSLFTYWYPGVAEAAETVRSIFREVQTVLGGVYATLCPDHARTLPAVDDVHPGPSAAWIKGFLAARKLPVRIPRRFADYTHYKAPLRHGAVMTSFGCPFSCRYCASSFLQGAFRRRPLEDVMEDLVHIAGQGAVHAAVVDDAFLYRAEDHALPLLRALSRADMDLSLHFPNGLHVRYLTDEVAALLCRAGAETIRLSFEDLSPEGMIDSCHKASEDDLRSAAHALEKAGFDPARTGVYTLLGAPGSKRENLEQTYRFIHRLGLRILPSLYSPIPRTPFFDDAVVQGLDPGEPLLQNKTAYTHYREKDSPTLELRDLARDLNEKL